MRRKLTWPDVVPDAIAALIVLVLGLWEARQT